MWNEWLVKNAEFALKCIFSVLEVTIAVPLAVYKFILPPPAPSSRTKEKRPTVVIVGGNFAGLAALWQLKPYADRFRIIVIEQKDYFEYIPGILRLFCQPKSLKDLAQPLPRSPLYEIIQGRVINVQDSQRRKTLAYHPVHNGAPSTAVQTVAYDYLILATGATYNHPITPSIRDELSLIQRQKSWNVQHNQIKQAQSILMLGAGAVGVELAAELIDLFPQKSITLVDANPTMAPLFPSTAGKYAQKWLQDRGVTVRLGEMLQSWDDTSCTLQTNGQVLKADRVFVCFGSKANSQAMDGTSDPQLLTAGQSGTSSSSTSALGTVRNFVLNRRKDVVVKKTLQVEGGGDIAQEGCVFVVGDVSDPPSEGIKQAFQAEVQGYVAGKNVVNKELGKPLLRYPQDVAHSDRMPLVYVLSLGRFDGVLGFNELTIPGPFAAIVKFIIEYTKVMHMSGKPLGSIIWKLGDNIVMFLSRTLIKPAATKKD